MNGVASTKDTAILDDLMIPFVDLLNKDGVTELVVNRPCEILIETLEGWQSFEYQHIDRKYLERLATSIAGYSNQHISDKNPLISTTLKTGERVQIVAPPAAIEYSFTIRKPSGVSFSMDKLDKYGLFSDVKKPSVDSSKNDDLIELYNDGKIMQFLTACVLAKKNIIISGATGSGKTTLSDALINKIPKHERLLTIEDTRELNLEHHNLVNMVYSKGGQGLAAVDAKDLLEASMRMRPDRILMQELRDGVAFDYLRNVNSGHPGSITTVHANTPKLAFEQLMMLVKQSDGGGDLERSDIKHLLNVLVDVVVQCKKVNGTFRVTEIWYGDVDEAA